MVAKPRKDNNFWGGMWSRGESKDNRAESKVKIARINLFGPKSASWYSSTPNCTSLTLQYRCESTKTSRIHTTKTSRFQTTCPTRILPTTLSGTQTILPLVPEHARELPIQLAKEKPSDPPLARVLGPRSNPTQATKKIKSKKTAAHSQ